jgi:predicted AlkP superfamily phosphohydrolase/phosphomutase
MILSAVVSALLLLAAPMSRSYPAARRSFSQTLFSSYLAGQAVGLGLLAAGLYRHTDELVRMPPSTGYGLWILIRSVGTYAVLGGILAAILGAALYGSFRLLGRGSHPTVPLVSGLCVGGAVLVQLTAWRQIRVLTGLPLSHPERIPAALLDLFYAGLAGAAVVAVALLVLRRREPSSFRPLQSRSLKAGAALLPLLCLVFGLLALRLRAPAEAGDWRPSQIAVVGLDAATLRILGPMIRDGSLPTFRRLVDEGAWGTLLTYGIDSSPMVWTSIATGKRVRDHGIYDWVKIKRGARAEPMKSSDRRARAIWNIASDIDLRVGVVDWLITYPPEQVNGYLVTRLHMDQPNRTFPPELEAETAAIVTNFRDHGDPFRTNQFAEIDHAFDVAEMLLLKDSIDLLMMFEPTTDNLQHGYWKYYQPEAFDGELWDLTPNHARPGEIIPDSYKLIDNRLERLWSRLDEDALLMVVSDHGQLAAAAPLVWFDVDKLLYELGVLSFRRDEPSRPDFDSTRAYSAVQSRWVPRMGININLAGRESHGTVDGQQGRSLQDELVTRLHAVEFTDGTPVFGPIRATGAFEEGDAESGKPDIEVTHSGHTRTLRSAKREILVDGRPFRLEEFLKWDQSLSGEHDRKGVIFLHGKGIRRGFLGQPVISTALQELVWHLTDKVEILDRVLPLLRRVGLVERATTLDITPTILSAWGLPVAEDMAGRPLAELALVGESLPPIATYEISTTAAEDEVDAASDEELLERLKALGYIQ